MNRKMARRLLGLVLLGSFAMMLALATPDTESQAKVWVVRGNGNDSTDAVVLKAVVEDSSASGDTVYVRGGPFMFGSTGAPKPLTINTDILFEADSNQVVIEGRGAAVFDLVAGSPTNDICGECAEEIEDTQAGADSCSWMELDPADDKALILVNSSRVGTNLVNADILRIKGFEFRYGFRTGGVTAKIGGTDCACFGSSLNNGPGGAIEAWRSKLTIEDCYIHHNSVTRYSGRGGGIAAMACSLTVDNCTIEDNWGGYYGGGLFVSDGALGSCSPCCDSTTVLPHDPSTFTLKNSVVRRNFGEYGGGMLLASTGCGEPSHINDEDGGLEVTLEDNLIANNCVMRFNIGHGSAGAGVYLAGNAASIKRNTFAGNASADNTGALFFVNGSTADTDAIKWNIFGDNQGGGIHVTCFQLGAAECAGGADYCVQGIIDDVEDNLFYNNYSCSSPSADNLHVVAGLGRSVGVDSLCALPTALWEDCETDCDSTANHIIRWADDVAIQDCGTDSVPRVPTTNIVCDPLFCDAEDYEVACCSPALLFDFGSGTPGYDQIGCSGTSSCPYPTPVESSMSAWSEPSQYAGSLVLKFAFDAAAPAEEFTVQFREKKVPEASWITLDCTTAGTNCEYDLCASYIRTASVSPCVTKKYEWKVKAENCRGETSYSSVKTFTGYCITEP